MVGQDLFRLFCFVQFSFFSFFCGHLVYFCSSFLQSISFLVSFQKKRKKKKKKKISEASHRRRMIGYLDILTT